MTKQTFLSIISITILTFCIPLASAEGSELPMSLVPYPQEVLVSEGSFTPSKQLFLSHDGSHGELADTCVKDLSAMGFIASHGNSDAKMSGSIIKLT